MPLRAAMPSTVTFKRRLGKPKLFARLVDLSLTACLIAQELFGSSKFYFCRIESRLGVGQLFFCQRAGIALWR